MSSFLLRGLGMRTASKMVAGPAARRTLKTEAEIHALRPDGKVPNPGLEISFALFLGCACGGVWWLYAQSEFKKLDAWDAKLKAMRDSRDK